MDIGELYDKFNKLKIEHTHDRDNANDYGCFNVEACRNCNFVYNSRACLGCHNCDGCIDCVQCVDCRHCAFCVGLNGARYAILNQEYPEQEYYAKLDELGVDHSFEGGL